MITSKLQRFHVIACRESLLTVLRQRLLYEVVYVLAPDLTPYSDHHIGDEVGVNRSSRVCVITRARIILLSDHSTDARIGILHRCAECAH